MRSSFLFLWQILCIIYISHTNQGKHISILRPLHITYFTQWHKWGVLGKAKSKTALIRYPYMQTTKAPLKSYSAYIPRGSGLYTIYCRTKQKRVGICITIQPLNMYLNTALSSKYREKKKGSTTKLDIQTCWDGGSKWEDSSTWLCRK